MDRVAVGLAIAHWHQQMKGIPIYNDINDLHRLTGSALRTDNPLFHCFDMAHANDLTNNDLLPHRADFFTLALSSGTKGLTYTLNGNTFQCPKHFILCVAPGQIATWEKTDQWFGYCTFFKTEFIQVQEKVNFLTQYPFFNISETNFFPLERGIDQDLTALFQQILKEQTTKRPFSMEIIRALFQTILWNVRRIYEDSIQHNSSIRASAVLTAQFQFLVNEHFLELTKVEEYAELMHISANHLSQTVKQTTGKTAKSIINERRLNEAKFLLAYTDHQIGAIAYYLNFSEPTHFTKLFKKHVSTTPQLYRSKHQLT